MKEIVRRILLVLTVAPIMAAIVGASVVPGFAVRKTPVLPGAASQSCEGQARNVNDNPQPFREVCR